MRRTEAPRRLHLALVLAVLAVTGCTRRATRPREVRAAVATIKEQGVMKALDTRCPAALEATRDGGLDADRYRIPTDAERHAIRDTIQALVAGDRAEAQKHVGKAGFEIVDLPEMEAVLVREVGKKRGGGAYVVRVASSSRLVVQAPHTFFDEGTLPLACELFERSRGQALFISTAHRYKSAPKDASGNWPADVAHAKDSLFQAATIGLLKTKPKHAPSWTVVQVHGFGERESGGAMVLSAGVRTPGQSIVSRASLALGRVVDQQHGAILRFPEDQNELGATTNVQGSIVREAGGQFLHVEMAAPMRRVLLENSTLRANVLATLADALEGV